MHFLAKFAALFLASFYGFSGRKNQDLYVGLLDFSHHNILEKLQQYQLEVRYVNSLCLWLFAPIIVVNQEYTKR
jgi:hypothetical protein